MQAFKNKYPLDKRIADVNKVLSKYPDRIPVIVVSDNIEISHHKYLTPTTLNVFNFIITLRKKIKTLNSNEAIFLFTKNTMLSQTCIFDDLYKKYKDKDGFLYITISKENTFG